MGLSSSTGIRSLSLNKYDRRIKKYNGKVLEAGMGYTIPKKESTIDDTCLVHRERKISIAGGLSSTTAWLPIATESATYPVLTRFCYRQSPVTTQPTEFYNGQ